MKQPTPAATSLPRPPIPPIDLPSRDVCPSSFFTGWLIALGLLSWRRLRDQTDWSKQYLSSCIAPRCTTTIRCHAPPTEEWVLLLRLTLRLAFWIFLLSLCLCCYPFLFSFFPFVSFRSWNRVFLHIQKLRSLFRLCSLQDSSVNY